MASCLAGSRLLVSGPVVRGAEERPIDSTGPPTIGAQVIKKRISTRPGTFEFAKYTLVFTTRFQRFDRGDSGVVPWEVADRIAVSS